MKKRWIILLLVTFGLYSMVKSIIPHIQPIDAIITFFILLTVYVVYRLTVHIKMTYG